MRVVYIKIVELANLFATLCVSREKVCEPSLLISNNHYWRYSTADC